MTVNLAEGVTLRLAEYDLYNVSDFERELDMLTAGHCTLNLENVRFLDSTCLAALVRALKRMRIVDPSSELTLTNLRAPLQRIFRITGLWRIFHIE